MLGNSNNEDDGNETKTSTVIQGDSNNSIEIGELEMTIKKLKTGKALGHYRITLVMIKYLGGTGR